MSVQKFCEAGKSGARKTASRVGLSGNLCFRFGLGFCFLRPIDGSERLRHRRGLQQIMLRYCFLPMRAADINTPIPRSEFHEIHLFQ